MMACGWISCRFRLAKENSRVFGFDKASGSVFGFMYISANRSEMDLLCMGSLPYKMSYTISRFLLSADLSLNLGFFTFVSWIKVFLYKIIRSFYIE